MSQATEGLQVRFPVDLKDIESDDLDALLDPDQPFLTHAFLSALEESGCVSDSTGWCPHHFSIWDADDKLIAFAPVYLKKHSYGEYVFDWAWADAYQRHGMRYYPKILCSVPFTPSISSRLVHKADSELGPLIDYYALFRRTVADYAEKQSLSSAHVLFPSPVEHCQATFGAWQKREGVQYHWFNRDYETFDDFLAQLNSSKRKNIRKERCALSEQGIAYEWCEGSSVTQELFDLFYQCYERTYNVRGQMAYLNRAFFSSLFSRMGEKCLVLFAKNPDDEVLASALFIKGENTLYGRYWGALENISFLHFELCYYAGIEYCIENGMQRFDAGAQGEHKLLRGFEPVPTASFHNIRHPDFRAAITNFLHEEKEHIEQYREDAKRWLPYKNKGSA